MKRLADPNHVQRARPLVDGFREIAATKVNWTREAAKRLAGYIE